MERKQLENYWYKELKNGRLAYEVYKDQGYYDEVLYCWHNYSRKYLQLIAKPNGLVTKSILFDMGDIKSVVDIGCGIGYTTMALKKLFPNAMVYGTDLEGTIYNKIAKNNELAGGYKLKSNINEIGHNVDLVFASEYFEHLEKPIDELIAILETLNPKYLIIANSFNTVATGHFDKYIVGNEIIDQKDISRKFNKTLRERGYEKIKTKLWNNRPSYWKKI